MPAKRLKRLRACLSEHGLDQVLEAIARISASRFCCGENERGWKATFGFLLEADRKTGTDKITSALEGRYDDRQRKPEPPKFRNGFMQNAYDDYVNGVADDPDEPAWELPSIAALGGVR
jgi:hypothetical protein